MIAICGPGRGKALVGLEMVEIQQEGEGQQLLPKFIQTNVNSTTPSFSAVSIASHFLYGNSFGECRLKVSENKQCLTFCAWSCSWLVILCFFGLIQLLTSFLQFLKMLVYFCLHLSINYAGLTSNSFTFLLNWILSSSLSGSHDPIITWSSINNLTMSITYMPATQNKPLKVLNF